MTSARYSLVTAISLLLGCSFLNQGAAQEGAPNAGKSAPRVWTDAAGREILATLEGFKDKDTLVLRLQDGRSIPYPVSKLSSGDQGFARKAYEKQGATKDIDWKNPKVSESYVIRGVRRKNAPGFVYMKSGGWEYAVKSIEVKVQYKGGKESAPADVRAYFYNREGKLIDQFDKPPRRQGDDRKYINAPESYKKSKLYEHYFPLTPFLKESDWATVLVVFGSGENYSAKMMPGGSFENLAFDEKEYIFPEWDPNSDKGDTGKATMSNVELEIRRLKKIKHPLSLSFDGPYKKGMPCLKAEVRAMGDISPANGVVKLYVFNDAGKLVASRMRPSSAAISGYNSYVGVPQIADDRWHPVFFALDGDLKEKKHPTYVLVFQFAGKTSAVVESSAGATIADLDFPEKGDLKP